MPCFKNSRERPFDFQEALIKDRGDTRFPTHQIRPEKRSCGGFWNRLHRRLLPVSCLRCPIIGRFNGDVTQFPRRLESAVSHRLRLFFELEPRRKGRCASAQATKDVPESV